MSADRELLDRLRDESHRNRLDLVAAVERNDKLKDECSNLKARAFVNAITHVSAAVMLVNELSALRGKLSEMRGELRDCADALPGTHYMDPPDGGSVTIAEQLRRMAEDAARFRRLSDLFGSAKTSACEQVLWGLGLSGDVCDDLGKLVDSHLGKLE